MTSVRDARVDADGVRIVDQGGARRIVAVGAGAVVLVVLVTVGAVLMLDGRTIVHAPARPPAVEPAVVQPSTVADVPTAPVAPAPQARDVHPRLKRSERKAAASAAAAAKNDEGELDARDVIPMLQAAGEHEGIAAFPVPGTDPPKAGLVVPEDFALPEGYVRHSQATDDGGRLPAILMFHPDYEFVDATGTPIELPADGVVPPALAPPGMPLERLELPDREP
jgi:hypothetical protein